MAFLSNASWSQLATIDNRVPCMINTVYRNVNRLDSNLWLKNNVVHAA
jgi:hypothetical protein